MKLFTIGDSISQGFMSLAAARTDLCFSTLIAQNMGLSIGQNYRYPDWPKGGLPAAGANIEVMLRTLNQKFKGDINGLDWARFPLVLDEILDQAEDYYEGRVDPKVQQPKPPEFYHNVAVQGFDIADAWMITPATCQAQIAKSEAKGEGKDGFLGSPSASFYRTALRVLNPTGKPEYQDFTQLKWLETHATNSQEGVENLLLWLGSNNALGTVIGLKVSPTPNDRTKVLDQPSQNPTEFREIREQWNLWHPQDFQAEYQELLDRVDQIMQNNSNPDWQVFVGTVPLVTIAPLAKGVGPTTEITIEGDTKPSVYYKYYTYFFLDEDSVRQTDAAYLTLQDALHIDDCIRQYNAIIRDLVAQKNARYDRTRYHVVDICTALREIAFKRNAGRVNTHYFPDYFKFLYPQVNTKYYHADQQGRLRQGGLVSLDGVHPSAIGHGLIAYEFLKRMQEAGAVSSTDLNWPQICANDSLYSDPIPLMHEFYEHKPLAEWLLKATQRFRRAK